LLVQALLLGSAALLPLATFESVTRINRDVTPALLWVLVLASLLHVLMVWGEVSLTHATAHARLAVWEMVNARYKSDFWIGMVLSMLGGVIPWLAVSGVISISMGVAGAPLALMGMM